MKVILVFLLVSCISNAQHVKKIDDLTAAAFEDIMENYINNENVPGIALGIIQDGKVAFTHSEGEASTSPSYPFLSSTKSLLASVSKTITAIMAMKMVAAGDLDLDETIDAYIAGYNGTSITIRHLLDHQSGIGHYPNCPGGYNGPWNYTSSINVVMGCSTCVTPPGAASWYTTFGTTLLGAVIHSVGLTEYGLGYIGLYNTWIKNPGGLTTLTPEFDNSDPNLAKPHFENGNQNNNQWEDIGWKLPAGGFSSNIGDLAKYGVGIMNYTFLDSIRSNQMWAMQGTNGSPFNVNCAGNVDGNYGLGFSVTGSGLSLQISHSGVNSHGYRSRLCLWPNLKKGYVFLINQDAASSIVTDFINDIVPLVLCPTSRNFTSLIDWPGDWNYLSSGNINASSMITNTSANMTFGSDQAIRLTEGFNAKVGVDFHALIDGCSN